MNVFHLVSLKLDKYKFSFHVHLKQLAVLADSLQAQILITQIYQSLLLKNHCHCYLILSTKIHLIKFSIRQGLLYHAISSMIPFEFL